MTWVTRPTWVAAVAMKLSFEILYLNDRRSLRASDRLGAGDDLDQLLGDLGLTGSVIDLGLLADHFAGVAGRVVHRAHLSAVERGVVFQQRAENLDRDIARQQSGEKLVLFRLIFVGRRRRIRRLFFHGQRNDLLRG